jgi:putative iron-regulated protein
MKRNIRTNALVISCLLVLIAAGCKDECDNIKVDSFPINNGQQQTILGLAQIEKAIALDWLLATSNLDAGATSFRANTSDVNLASLQNLWKLSRDPWESNESFGFGPVSTDGIDASSDDWPFDITAFNSILNSSQTLNQDLITQMTTTTKGFHAIEYLLFGADGKKQASDFTSKELQMLTLLSTDLKTQADKLNTRWTTGSANSFHDDFAAAGTTGSSYATTSAALGEVLGSMIDIMTELPDSKIQTPLTLQNNAYLESRFSDYSFYDYRNNINGVYSVYVGQYKNVKAQNSLSNLVATGNPGVNEKVLTQFRLCLGLMDLIQPPSMNNAILTKQDQLSEIVVELQKLNRILDGDVREVLGL